jgi:Kef-type K+ transport system membrane component KefB
MRFSGEQARTLFFGLRGARSCRSLTRLVFAQSQNTGMTAAQASATFFLQMFVILLVCRVVGWLARRLGQPQVVGEMIAGVFLGPSLLGLIAPEVQEVLFPKESLKFLYVGAQLGVGLYMFLVGVEFSNETFLRRARSAATVSAAGMLAPFILGAVLAFGLVKVPGLFSERATLVEAMLFMGAACPSPRFRCWPG